MPRDGAFTNVGQLRKLLEGLPSWALPPRSGAAMPEDFTCTACGGTFEKAWSEAEAQKELGDLFPGVPVLECALVCDDCFKAMGLEPSPSQKKQT